MAAARAHLMLTGFLITLEAHPKQTPSIYQASDIKLAPHKSMLEVPNGNQTRQATKQYSIKNTHRNSFSFG